ncbi:cytochrome P450 family protein [Coleophoma crateriformis]|uniref:Cytochrome P450 family protein n=1 Tax=Coleophoma crateriformis TaxID=565419 RepID=A0A3D8RP07_9HELO|nr:cytochrome P450 family protein [Coleophoma crateriformis]
MPSLWANIVFICLVSWAAYKLILISKETKRIRAEAAKRGCLPAPTLHSNNLLGTSRLKESIQANKEDRGPQYVVSAMNELGHDIHTVRVPVFNYELLVTRDPENARAIFSTHAADFDISPTRAMAFMPLMGPGVFTATGEAWKHSRALVRPQFSHEEVANLDLEERHVQNLLRHLEPGSDGWTAKVDMAPLCWQFTLDTATEFLYGQSVNSLLPGEDSKVFGNGITGAEFGEHLNEAKHFVDKRGALAKYYWLIKWSRASKEFNARCAEIHRVVDRMIDERLRDTGSEKDLENPATSHRTFVLLDELAKLTQNRAELRSETLHILTAGRDTTGALLGWVFYMLARYPAVYAELRRVILAQFGSSATDIDFKDLRNCQYLQFCLNETIRIVAIIPMNERVALRDTTLPRGGGPNGNHPIFVPKGNQVLIPKYAMQHRPDLWGEDPDVFRPERWEGRKTGFEFIPFGAGPRKCLGQQFAYTEAGYLIVRFLQKFDKCENMEGPGRIRLHTAIENRSGTGVQVRFHAVEE